MGEHPPDDGDPELLGVFREEVAEAVDALAQAIEAWRASTPREADATVAAAFRVAHNIKGAARVAGVREVEALAHAVEDGLTPFRGTGRRPAPALLDHLADASTLIGRASQGEDVTRAALALRAVIAESASEEGGAPRESPEVVSPKAPTGTGMAKSVRVPVERLDAIMTFAAEMIDAQWRLRGHEQGLRELTETLESARAALPVEHRTALDTPLARVDELERDGRADRLAFGHLTVGFNDAVRKARMLPLGGAAARWRGIVRETAQQLGKRVELAVEVSDIEIDKQILDALADPMMHLLRNAVAHGVESPAERAAVGKSAVGRIKVAAEMAGGTVRIEVQDDGRGFDLARMRRRGEALGLLASGEQASVEDVIALAFAPGFSTAAEVDSVSGRGVGLDAVRAGVEAVGGRATVAASGALGGASFGLEVPPSLVSTHGLLVRAGAVTYALPIANVRRTLSVATSTLERSDGGMVVRPPSGGPLRLLELGAAMDQTASRQAEKLILVVVAHSGLEVALAVDEILGEEELVTKRLPWNLRHVDWVSGIVALASGGAAVVVDLARLVEIAHRRGGGMALAIEPRAESRKPRILVVDDSLTSRTLERNILKAAGYEVDVAVDGEQAWERFNQTRPDLVISDVDMPRLDGLELTRRIRAHATRGKVPVILVTSLERPEDLAAGAAAGADEYVVKGKFDQRLLLEAVARLS